MKTAHRIFLMVALCLAESVQLRAEIADKKLAVSTNRTGMSSSFAELITDDVTEFPNAWLELRDISILNVTFSDNTTSLANSTEDGLSESVQTREKYLVSWRISFNKVQFFVQGLYFPTVVISAALGNGIVLSVLRKDALQSSSNVYLMGLAVADIIFLVNYSPKTFVAFDTIIASRVYQTFRAFHISYFLPLVSICHTASVWITISFTVERYIAVTWPLKSKEYFTKHRARFAVIVAFVFGMALNGMRFFRRRVVPTNDPVTNERYFSYTFTDFGRDKTVESLTFWSYLLLAEILPFVILICLNSAIIWNLWMARKTRLTMAGESGADKKNGNCRENHITRMLIAIVIAFLICNALAGAGSIWVAVNGAESLYTTDNPNVFYLFLLAPAFYITNPLVNCIVYAVCSKAIRDGIKSQLQCCIKQPCLGSSPTTGGETDTTTPSK